MAKFRVLEIQTLVKEFEVEAENRDEAIDKVISGEGEFVREKIVECEHETENLTLKGGEHELLSEVQTPPV